MTFVKRIFSDRLWLSATGVVVVLALAVSYMFAVVLDTPLTERPINVDIDLAQTGGLFEGSAVTYRGSKIGKVTKIVPDRDGGVTASVRISAGTQVPTDSLARVRSLSPVGEQYVDFQPNTAKSPFLKDGDRVEAAATDIPESLHSTVIAISKVMDQIDDKKLKTLLTELSTGLVGTGDDLGQIVDQAEELLATLNAVWPETDRLITNTETVLDIVVDNATSLRELGTSSRQFARFLRDYTPEFRRILKQTPDRLKSLEGVVKDTDEYLPEFLTTGASFANMFRPWNPHLRALLQEYPAGVASLTSVLSGGALQVDLYTIDTERCTYGTGRNAPTDVDTEFQTEGLCPASFGRLQRGAAHAPGPAR